jgi:hypothetical protein
MPFTQSLARFRRLEPGRARGACKDSNSEPAFQPKLKFARSSRRWFRGWRLALQYLTTQQDAQTASGADTPLKIPTYSKTRFFSIILLLKRVIDLDVAISSALLKAFTTGVLSEERLNIACPSDDERALLLRIVAMMTPLMNACQSLGASSGVVSSSALPVLATALFGLRDDPNLSEAINANKKGLRRSMNEHVQHVFGRDSIYRLASFLDPNHAGSAVNNVLDVELSAAVGEIVFERDMLTSDELTAEVHAEFHRRIVGGELRLMERKIQEQLLKTTESEVGFSGDTLFDEPSAEGSGGENDGGGGGGGGGEEEDFEESERKKLRRTSEIGMGDDALRIIRGAVIDGEEFAAQQNRNGLLSLINSSGASLSSASSARAAKEKALRQELSAPVALLRVSASLPAFTSEVASYLLKVKTALGSNGANKVNPLDFWRENEKQLPLLGVYHLGSVCTPFSILIPPLIARLAKRLLALPVAQLSVERVFSASKLQIGSRQHRKKTRLVFAQVFLRERFLRKKERSERTVRESSEKRKR